MPSGYAHPAYAEALSEFGEPRPLEASGGTVLVRDTPGGGARDAMGCYPLFACRDWGALGHDLEAIAPELVSLAVVTDPFGAWAPEDLRRWFPDVARPFKEHFVVDLAAWSPETVSGHHRRNLRRAARAVAVEPCPDPTQFLPDWEKLYGRLVERHGIRGIAAFSTRSFAAQMRVPGLVALRAERAGRSVGMVLWYVQGDVAYYHLGAYDDDGYRLRASFALFACAIEHFQRAGLRWLDLGAGAGVRGDAEDGLSRFKRGWATDTRPAWFCGRIFQPAAYRRLVGRRGSGPTDFFPAYRAGEWDG